MEDNQRKDQPPIKSFLLNSSKEAWGPKGKFCNKSRAFIKQSKTNVGASVSGLRLSNVEFEILKSAIITKQHETK